MKSLMILSVFAMFLGAAHVADAKPKKKDPEFAAAKKVCLEENPELKGSALKKCIREKRK